MTTLSGGVSSYDVGTAAYGAAPSQSMGVMYGGVSSYVPYDTGAYYASAPRQITLTTIRL